MSGAASQRRRICIIAYDGIANPATRLRAIQFYPALEAAGFDVLAFYVPTGNGAPRAWTLRGLAAAVRRSDVVLVQRVLAWWLLPLLRLLGRPVVFDVDDAIHYIRQSQIASALAPRSIKERLTVLYRRAVRGGPLFSSRKRMFDRMMRGAAGLVVGNENLAGYVGAAARRLVVLPTSVAVGSFPLRRHSGAEPVRIGWIGVPSNLYHLKLLERVFAELTRRYGDRIRLVIVSNRGLDDLPIATEFVPWSLETESAVTAGFDIGIMPLQDDVFSRGKCSFKAIYCMGHGVPVVISPVGMNAELVEHGVNGFLASSDEEWVAALSALIDDPALRERCGAAARATIEQRYAADMIFPRLRALIESVIDARASGS